MNKSLEIGVIGTGVGIRTLIPGFRSTGNGHILGISGRDQYRAEKFAAELDIPKAFGDFRMLCDMEEIDLICIASPTEFHYQHAKYAIEKGKNVLCEKPLALTTSDIQKLVLASHNTDKICIVDHQLRFNPYIKKIKYLLSQKVIGRPYFIRIHQQSTSFSDRNAPWNWSFDVNSGGGVRLAMASHFVDLLNYWFGKICYLVNGRIDSVVSRRKNANGFETNVNASSFFSASLALEEGLEAHLSATAASCGISRFDVSIYGTEGELHFDLDNKLRGAFLSERGSVKNIPVEGVLESELTNKISFFAGTFRYFAPLIIDSILTKNRSIISYASSFDDAIFTQKVMDAILDSAKSGKTVELDKGYVPKAEI